jgi:two-component system nitrate/nitrite response regulator NarL
MKTNLANKQRSAERPSLTPRERTIAGLACRGLSNKEIGREIGISEGVVKLHLHRVYRKLGVQGRTGLMANMLTEVK